LPTTAGLCSLLALLVAFAIVTLTLAVRQYSKRTG
jgi:hypothetical protein